MKHLTEMLDDERESLAAALEEAAARVRMSRPTSYEADVQDDVEMIDVGGPSIPGLRRPLLRSFRIEW